MIYIHLFSFSLPFVGLVTPRYEKGDNLTYLRQKAVSWEMHKRETTTKKYEKFTKEELLTIFKEEAQYICRKPEEIDSFAESAFLYFIKRYGKYVKKLPQKPF
ncbi:MAG: hypothetical protein MRK02_10305 [Candidatus Scalindua sp.]|nr:hypothetical protein [Candidatus Scalindua sp.]